MLYSLDYTNSEMHKDGSPLTAVIGSTDINTENGSTLNTVNDPTPSECTNRTAGCEEVGSEHDWIWGSNCLHPYADPPTRSQTSSHQGHQEVLGASSNAYLPSHYHHHHHHHHHLAHPTATSSTGLYVHNHHHHHANNNNHHHHHHTQQQQPQQQQQAHRLSNQKYPLPGSKPDQRSSHHHPALSLSVGYNAAAVAAAAAIAAAAAVSSGGPGVTLTSGKPKRRRIPTVAQRRAANIRERRRMFNLNEAFDTLRKRVPTFAYEKRLSRIETLRLAITYISFMTDVISGKEPANIKLHGTKTFTWEALHALPPELNLHGKGQNSR